MQERIDTSSSNAPTRLGKVQISPGMDDNQIPMGCLRGGMLKLGIDQRSCQSLFERRVISLASLRPMICLYFEFPLTPYNFYHFSETRIGFKDYDLIHFLKEWFIALCKCTVIIPKLNWNLSHELKIFTSLYILELTLLYPQPCSYLQVIQAWAHFRQKFVKIFNERKFVPVKV